MLRHDRKNPETVCLDTFHHVWRTVKLSITPLDFYLPYHRRTDVDLIAAVGIGYLPQQGPLQRDFPASVREVVQSGCQALRGLRPFYTRDERRRATEAMERLGVATLAKRCYRELSGGQRQRVLLARAICGECRLLLLDEPTTGLDPDAAEEFYRTLHGINSGGVAVIMVSHDLDSALRSATHVLTLGAHASFERRCVNA